MKPQRLLQWHTFSIKATPPNPSPMVPPPGDQVFKQEPGGEGGRNLIQTTPCIKDSYGFNTYLLHNKVNLSHDSSWTAVAAGRAQRGGALSLHTAVQLHSAALTSHPSLSENCVQTLRASSPHWAVSVALSNCA